MVVYLKYFYYCNLLFFVKKNKFTTKIFMYKNFLGIQSNKNNLIQENLDMKFFMVQHVADGGSMSDNKWERPCSLLVVCCGCHIYTLVHYLTFQYHHWASQ